MQCREHCGACCIAPAINQAYFGMPAGKAAGVACVHLDAAMRCGLFGDPRRPALCAAFQPEVGICGDGREQAFANLIAWESLTLPDNVPTSGSHRLPVITPEGSIR